MRKTLVIVVVYLLVLTGFAEVQADMPMPVLTVEFAPGDNWNVASPTWVNITAEVRNSPGFRIRRGRQTPFTRMRPSTLTLVLDNSTGNFDPDNSSGAYANDLVPMVPIRVRATHNAVTYDLFRGFVTSWTVGQQDFKDTFTTITAIDGLSILQLYSLEQPFVDEVAADSPRVWYQMSDQTGTTAVDSSGNNYDGTYVGSPTLGTSGGPIIGDTDYYIPFDGTDDQIQLPVDGAFSGVTARSIEVWFRAQSGTDNDIDFYRQSISTGIGAESLYFYIANSTGKVTVDDRANGSINSRLVSALDYQDGGWHQAVYTEDASGNAELYIDGASVDTDAGSIQDLAVPDEGKAQIGVGANGTTFDAGDISEFIMYDSELSAARVLAHYNAGIGWINELTSARIATVLDLAGWPSADRTLSTGKSTMGALTSSIGSYLAAAFQAQDTEDSELWIGGDGKVVFTNRDDRNLSAYAATFSNDTGGDSVYRDFKWVSDEQLLRNVGRVTDSAGVVAESRDTTSEARFGTRVVSRTSQTTTAGEPLDYADWLAAEFGSARRRGLLTLLSAQSSTNDSWAEMLSRELGDLISVENTPVSGGTQNQYDFFVEEINLRGTVEAWTMTLGLSPAVRQRMFTLDNDPLGKLDRSNQGLLGW